tara:strand:+ start:42 stop:344 length:303 start_codon:yes stop_codon:yes gene_type:complete
MNAANIKFGKAEGNGKQDGYTEAPILCDGEIIGFLTSQFERTDPCDWYSTRSSRCVAVEALMFDGKSHTVAVYNGYSKIAGVTSASARAEVKRWVRAQYR